MRGRDFCLCHWFEIKNVERFAGGADQTRPLHSVINEAECFRLLARRAAEQARERRVIDTGSDE